MNERAWIIHAAWIVINWQQGLDTAGNIKGKGNERQVWERSACDCAHSAARQRWLLKSRAAENDRTITNNRGDTPWPMTLTVTVLLYFYAFDRSLYPKFKEHNLGIEPMFSSSMLCCLSYRNDEIEVERFFGFNFNLRWLRWDIRIEIEMTVMNHWERIMAFCSAGCLKRTKVSLNSHTFSDIWPLSQHTLCSIRL